MLLTAANDNTRRVLRFPIASRRYVQVLLAADTALSAAVLALMCWAR
jgi:hypothetical protein